MSSDKLSRRLNKHTPEGWSVTTTAAHHLSLYHNSGRTIAMNEQRGQWTVMGLCQYADEDHPRFALEADTDTAIGAAIDAMEAVTAGDPEAAEIVARGSDLESPSSDGSEADIPSTTAKGSDTGHTGDSTDIDSGVGESTDTVSDGGQSSLSEF